MNDVVRRTLTEKNRLVVGLPYLTCWTAFGEMAAAVRLSFLVLTLLTTTTTATEQLDQVDKTCEEDNPCLHKTECETFTQGFAANSTLFLVAN